MPEAVHLPTALELTDLDAPVLGRLFTDRRRFSYELMFRSALLHKLRRVREGLETRPRRNLRALFYTYGRPLAVACGQPHRNPYLAFANAMNDLVRAGRLTYLDLGITDELWENRRIGAAHPGVLVVSEKEGQIRLLRTLHERLDVTIQAFRGNPSNVTCQYLAMHVKEALPPRAPLKLLAAVDLDPFGYQIAHAIAAGLRRFGLALDPPELLITHADVTPRELQRHGHRVRLARRHRRLYARWRTFLGRAHAPLALPLEAIPHRRLVTLCQQRVQAALTPP